MNFKQHDITDCGAICLAYVFYQHGFRTSVSSIRQKAGTNRGGTTALGLVETANACGFNAKGVRLSFEDLRNVSFPGIAHIVIEGGRQHYVVIRAISRKSVRVMDPSSGRVERWSIDRFKVCWTNVFIVLAPTVNVVSNAPNDSSWSKLWRLLVPQKTVLVQAFVGALLGTILSLSSAIYIQKIVDNVIVDGNRNLLRILGIAMLCILLVRSLLAYFQSILMLKSAQRIDAGLILGYYRHLMRLPQAFFDTMRVGEITSRIRDAVAVRDFLNGTILNLILNPLILIFALGAMFAYSSKLALFSLAVIPANIAIYLISDWFNKRYQRKIMESTADFDAQIVESLHAMSIVRSCGIEDTMVYRTETRLVRLLKHVWSAGNAGIVLGTTGTFVTQAYSVGLLWIGADLVLDSNLTAGELMSCNALAAYLTGPIVALIGMNAGIRTATTATERLYEVLDLQMEKDDGPSDLQLQGMFDLTFANVDFHHAGRIGTLSSFSLSMQSGSVVALVGESGCGKSTLLALVQRFYVPDSGAISINGIDIQYIRLASLRAKIASVPQRIDLLAGTVLENLAPNEDRPDIPRLVNLCKRLGLLEFIESLPRGFQTHITENGANFSGGQRQKLAIVRALYIDASIVLMDEPSSALDVASEDLLKGFISELRANGKLVILAVHNARILEICDRVVRMDICEAASSKQPPECPQQPAATATPDDAAIPQSIDCGTDTNGLVDKDATDETNTLFRRLRQRVVGGALFGQTDANVMGVRADGRGWFLEDGRCDIYEITGKFPAVYGFDLGHLSQGWVRANAYMPPKIREAFERNGVITVTWHSENPITGGNFYSGSPVSELLPGSPNHRSMLAHLDLIAENLGNLKNKDGVAIPILFRCWHECNGNQFWWGRSRCTTEEYIRLFRFTVTYLKEVCRVHNFIYVYAPGDYSEDFADYMERYPGDAFVDILGLDSYGDGGVTHQARLLSNLSRMVQYAEKKGKVAALTECGFKATDSECGLHSCKNYNWLSENLILPIKNHPVARKIAAIVFWRNEAYRPTNYYLPHAGSPHAQSLACLSNDSYLVFGDRLTGLYSDRTVREEQHVLNENPI